MIKHVAQRDCKPIKVFLDGEDVGPSVWMADDEAGVVIMIMTMKSPTESNPERTVRMIGNDIDRPDIQSPILYALYGKVRMEDL